MAIIILTKMETFAYCHSIFVLYWQPTSRVGYDIKDGRTYVCAYGRPDSFMIFTCNVTYVDEINTCLKSL